jgi:hypothetical protein
VVERPHQHGWERWYNYFWCEGILSCVMSHLPNATVEIGTVTISEPR